MKGEEDGLKGTGKSCSQIEGHIGEGDKQKWTGREAGGEGWHERVSRSEEKVSDVQKEKDMHMDKESHKIKKMQGVTQLVDMRRGARE